MIVLGLTGSIAMGKSTTAALFAAEGAAVYDADAAVHALYEKGGTAAARLAPTFPEAVTADGAVCRDRLRTVLAADPTLLAVLEGEIFPLVAAERQAFLERAVAEGRQLAVLDIPLLYETGADQLVDAVVVVVAALDVQRMRVMARPGMTLGTFELLSARQLPDDEKRRRADFVVHTDRGLACAADQVRQISRAVLAPDWSPPRHSVVAKAGAVSDIKAVDPGDQDEIHR